jgi:hypothetical protein
MRAGESDRSPHVLPAISAHFAGKTSIAAEAAMRAHLPTCRACHDEYQRHLVVAELDVYALSAEDRLGRALGFRMKPRRGWGRWLVGLAVPAAAALLLAVLPASRDDGDPVAEPNDGFAARSAPGSHASEARIWIYQVGGPAAPRRVDRTIAAGDELAFAYSNPAGAPFLMIFGVDEHRHVYWFHPQWPEGRPPPRALAAASGPGPHELAGAIRHTLDGQRLQIYALFSPTALDATAVEREVQRQAGDHPLSRVGPGTVIAAPLLEVAR